MSVIKTEGLTHVYSMGTPFQKIAVEDVNLEINEGEFIGLIGHTGSGKSTLIQHLNGLLEPTEGRIYIDGEDMWADKSKIRDFRFKVGLVFQYPEYQLFEETVYKDIAFGPKNMGLDEKEIEKRVFESAIAVGLAPELIEKSPFELSGGQKRRVAIAGVLAMEPRVLILDEPTAGLDPYGREVILNLIKKYHEEKNKTIIWVSHSMEDIARFAEKVLVMNESKVFSFGTVEEVFRNNKEIENIGLSIPQITKICRSLSEKGFDIDSGIFNVEAARDSILKLLKKKEG